MAKDDDLFRQVMEDVTETLTANLREVLDAGANIIVAGSAVFGGDIEGKTRALMSVLDEYNQR